MLRSTTNQRSQSMTPTPRTRLLLHVARQMLWRVGGGGRKGGQEDGKKGRRGGWSGCDGEFEFEVEGGSGGRAAREVRGELSASGEGSEERGGGGGGGGVTRWRGER